MVDDADRARLLAGPWAQMTDAELEAELDQIGREFDQVRCEPGHGGSPGEGLAERMDEIATELRRRGAQRG
jgi:hypothetical protein